MSYDAYGRPICATDPLGRLTLYTYDTNGNIISLQKPSEGKEIHYRYDLHNQPIQVEERSGAISLVSHSTYDLMGRKVATLDHCGNKTDYEYDAFGRLTKIIHPEVYDENRQPTRPIFSYSYDIFGNVLTITDPKGFVMSRQYNLRGQPSRIFYPDGSSELFKYDYDYLGRPLYEESSSAGEKGASSFVRSRSYNYNAFRCTWQRDDDLATQYSFDAAGRTFGRAVKRLSSKGELLYTHVYDEYDESGNLCSETLIGSVGKRELRKRILVVAIAPAAYIYPETCAMVKHYRAKPHRDKIPYIDKEGAKRAADTIIDLESHPDAAWFDHDFLRR